MKCCKPYYNTFVITKPFLKTLAYGGNSHSMVHIFFWKFFNCFYIKMVPRYFTTPIWRSFWASPTSLTHGSKLTKLDQNMLEGTWIEYEMRTWFISRSIESSQWRGKKVNFFPALQAPALFQNNAPLAEVFSSTMIPWFLSAE